MACRTLLATLVLFVIACKGDTVDGNDGSDPDPDASDPGDPDADIDPNQPDADIDPNQPDADIDPNRPDAAPPDCSGNGPKVPFASHAVPYASGTIKPSNRSQEQLDAETAEFYWKWKDAYFKTGCGGAFVDIGLENRQTVSEGHGYGMLILVLMAGEDDDAQADFDKLYQYYKAHPSEITPNLMAWAQNRSCQDVDGDNSATDGDLDIALALLMADKQWGSGGAVDYHQAAANIIDAIREGDVDGSGRWVLLGDWAKGDFEDATRTSDFMPGHFLSFAAASGDDTWTGIADFGYTMFSTLQNQFASGTGLLPDFVTDPDSPEPAPGGFLEGPNDGRYHYNACRDPWRLGAHYVTSGDGRAKALLDKLNNWVKNTTGNDPSDIRAGYGLNGSPNNGSSYTDMAFVAPFAVGATTGSAQQAWLNELWDFVEGTPITGYYGDSIKMLSMITVSGNWWTPEDVVCE